MCNREIKFGRLLEKILGSSHNDEDGVWMATGKTGEGKQGLAMYKVGVGD